MNYEIEFEVVRTMRGTLVVEAVSLEEAQSIGDEYANPSAELPDCELESQNDDVTVINVEEGLNP